METPTLTEHLRDPVFWRLAQSFWDSPDYCRDGLGDICAIMGLVPGDSDERELLNVVTEHFGYASRRLAVVEDQRETAEDKVEGLQNVILGLTHPDQESRRRQHVFQQGKPQGVEIGVH
jgi:hypothetical protein